jgi:hypothetical protein
VNPASPTRRNDPCPCGSGRRYKHCHGDIAYLDRELDRALEQRGAGEFRAALATIDEALAHAPDHARLANIQGVIRQELKDLDGAMESFHKAIELSPEFADAHFNLGILLLALGDYERGWAEYEWRTRRPGYADYANYPFGMPRWRGEPPAGKRILVHAEQGLGDTIQCVRFLERLAGDGAHVDLFCQPPLIQLMQRVRGVGRAWATLDERPTHDYHAPIIDVAAHYLPAISAPHWMGPYISPLPERVGEWASLLADAPRPLVGIAWKGNARHVNDRMRSLTPELALELAKMAQGVTFVNLQAGEPPPAGADWIDAGSRIRDWDDTVAIIDSLDLVVCVDTAVAHVAGAMGKPVWLLRCFSPEWRWGASGDTTRWYPSMRIFWQDLPGDWSRVLERVGQAISTCA